MILKERIKQFILHSGLTTQAFERECNLSNGAVNKLGDRPHGLTLSKISERYPELNISWALTGEGEMINDPLIFEDKKEKKTDNIPDYVITLIESNKEILSQNSKLMDLYSKQNDQMMELIKNEFKDLKSEISANKKETAHPDDLAECADAEK